MSDDSLQSQKHARLSSHTWEGTFCYQLSKKGHQWFYEDRESWKFRQADHEKFQRLSDIAAQITKPEVFNSIPPPYNDSRYFPFTKWLTNRSFRQCPPAGLSMVLNSIILNSSLKSCKAEVTFVDSHATVHIQGLKEGEPHWFYLCDKNFPHRREEDMLINSGVFFDLKGSSLIRARKDFKDVAEPFRYMRALHKYTVIKYELVKGKSGNEKLLLTLRDTVVMCHYTKGKVCGCIPVPGKGSETPNDKPEIIKSPEVVVESPVVASALDKLSQVWQDRNKKKTVLISAPPGSGKEVFCNSIIFGNGRPTANFQSISLAKKDQQDLEKQLLGFCEGGQIRQGLIAKAAKSGLFLDEVHQPEDGKGNHSAVRAALLRPLEAGDYLPIGSSEPMKVDSVLFIMATSKGLDELNNFNPKDFWTRMTHVVRIDHPLEIYKIGLPKTKANLDHDQICNVITKFFNFFWWRHVMDIYDGNSGNELSHECARNLLDWQKEALEAVIIDGWIGKVSKEKKGKEILSGTKPAVVFAKTLMAVLNQNKPRKLLAHECSIRGINNMVSRLFFIAATNVAQGLKIFPDPKKFEELVMEIATEIIPIANLSNDSNASLMKILR